MNDKGEFYKGAEVKVLTNGEEEFKAHIEEKDHVHTVDEREAIVFKSKTFAIVLEDMQLKPVNLFEPHMNATTEDFKKL